MGQRPNYQEPVEKRGTLAHIDEHGSKAYTHPAFGNIMVSRTSGLTTLYGSDFEHHHYVTLRITRSELHRDLSNDSYFPREELIEVAMSEAQWASFITSMNSGSGAPCTIERVQGERMPLIPRRKQEDSFKAELNRKVEGVVQSVDKAIADIEGELGSSLSQKRRDAILGHLKGLRMQLKNNMPFVAQQFAEHMEKTVEDAKAEVNAYMTQQVQRVGLAALGGTFEPPLQLTDGTEPPDAD